MTVFAVAVGDLLQVVLASLVAGLGVTVIFALAIVGATRARDAHRNGQAAATLAWAGLSVAALTGVAAAVLAGLWVLAR